jgi:hypothetical protein
MTWYEEGNSCLVKVDFPLPAGPAKNIAFGLPCISFNKVANLIIFTLLI